MKIPMIDTHNKKNGEIQLPNQFEEPVRVDIIRRAVLSFHSKVRQSYGALATAGLRAQAKLSRRRRDYKGSYGLGISRVPRKIMSRSGTRFNWVGAVSPGTVKGRRAHPPKPAKDWVQKINKKENRKAIRSAIAATVIQELVKLRGHNVPAIYPFVIDNAVESIGKTKKVWGILETLGFEKELARSQIKKIRAGRGKARGRPYHKKRGLLIVVGKQCALIKAAQSIPGIEVVQAHELNAELLAPGSLPGRITLWTENAIERLKQERLFV